MRFMRIWFSPSFALIHARIRASIHKANVNVELAQLDREARHRAHRARRFFEPQSRCLDFFLVRYISSRSGYTYAALRLTWFRIDAP